MSTYAWMALGAVIVVSGVLVWLVREFVVLKEGKPPITSLTRAVVLRWPGRALMVTHTLVFVIGIFVAHFIWDATHG